MRNLIVYINIFAAIVFLACNEDKKQENTNHNIIVSGKILNFQDHQENYTIKIHERNLTNYNSINHTEFIREDGTFRFEFKKYYKSDVYMVYGKIFTILVAPGDSIYVEFDANEFLDDERQNFWTRNSLKFSGDRALTNQQINLFHSLISSYKLIDEFSENEKNLAPNEYLLYLKDRKSNRKNILDSLKQNANLTNEFINWCTFFVDYQFGLELLHYTWYNPKMNGKAAMVIPQSFHNSLKDISLDNENSIICTEYNWYLKEYYQAYTFRNSELYTKLKKSKWNYSNSESFESNFILFLEQIEKEYTGIAKEILLSRELFKLMDVYNRVDVFEKIYSKYREKISNKLTVVLDKKYSEIKLNEENLLSGNIQKSKNKLTSIKPDIINKILEENKGKVIYIDFWATWCGPCLIELPNSKRLHKELADRNVEFVYLCVKSKQNDWEEKLNEFNLKGTHYLITDTDYNILSDMFQISGIPHYVLYNKNGVLIENGSYLRPNAAKEEILKLLNN